MTRRWRTAAGALVVALSLAGCVDVESPRSSERAPQGRFVETTGANCAVGERPGYFVPGPAATLLGCARLGVSGKRVEFSGNVAHIDGGRHACVNPAYSGRGQRGLFIPSKCMFVPALSRFAVRDAAQPRQGVRGYAYVIWGTAGASKDVVARFTGGTARAAVFRVGPTLARRFGESAFSLFVLELPLSAACGPVAIAIAIERIPPQAKLCARAKR